MAQPMAMEIEPALTDVQPEPMTDAALVAMKARLAVLDELAAEMEATEAAKRKPNTHKMEWKSKHLVMQEIVKHDGVVFGGAVRDWYIHNYNATKFYEAIQNEPNRDALTEKYADPTFLPEFKNRRVIPNDIDAMIPQDCLAGFLDALKKQGFQTINYFKRDAKKYLPNLTLTEGQMMHHRYAVQFIPANIVAKVMSVLPTTFRSDIAVFAEIQQFAQNLATMFAGDASQQSKTFFFLDLMVAQNNIYYDPPFGCLDFECNGLLMDKSGIRLTKSLAHTWKMCPFEYTKAYDRILDDILHFRARVVHRDVVETYRVKKMVQKGWSIMNFATVDYIQKGSTPAYDGYCIICQDTLPADHYKMKCCDARFHAKCLIRTTFDGVAATNITGSCIMCKKSAQFPHQYAMDAELIQQICDCHPAKPAAPPALRPLPPTLALVLGTPTTIVPAPAPALSPESEDYDDEDSDYDDF